MEEYRTGARSYVDEESFINWGEIFSETAVSAVDTSREEETVNYSILDGEEL